MVPAKLNSRIHSPLAALLFLAVGCDRSADITEDTATAGRVSATYHGCTLCHSTREMQRGPLIDGLPAWYIEAQVAKFRAGTRGGNPENRAEQLMASALKDLDPDLDIHALARFIERQPRAETPTTTRGDVEAGAEIYATCIPCHGHNGEGNEQLKAPPIAMLEDWYLLDQLGKFHRGLRGHDAGDVEGTQMRAVTALLTPEDLRNVTAYVVDRLGAGQDGDE